MTPIRLRGQRQAIGLTPGLTPSLPHREQETLSTLRYHPSAAAVILPVRKRHTRKILHAGRCYVCILVP